MLLRILSKNQTSNTFVQLLSAAAAAKSSPSSAGEQCHAAATKLGFQANVFVNTALLNLYCRSCQLQEAQQLFDEMPDRNAVTWSTLIYGHAQSREPALAVEAFGRMLQCGVSPTASSVSSVLVACAKLEYLATGAMLHCIGLKCGVHGSVVVGTALVDVYAKCREVYAARKVLDAMEERNVVTWTSLLGGYALNRRSHDAMRLVREMAQWGVAPNKMTYNSLLSSFANSEDLDRGKQVHCVVIQKGLEHNPYISATLLTMYSKCGSLGDFKKVQMAVSCQDQVSCNSVISGLSHLGGGEEVLERFLQMRRQCMVTDLYTFASVLKAIGNLSALREGTQLHALILKTGYAANVSVQNGLVSMYARCGAICESKNVFSSMEEPDLVSWNSLLSGCAQHGYGTETVEMFEQMRRLEVRPDHTTFLSVLTACTHVGLVEKGLEYFDLMKEKGFLDGARLEHYACVVDLLGRAGYLEGAESFINEMPIRPGVSVYRALLNACRIHGNLEIAKRVSKCLIELHPHDSSAHVLLSNVFAADGSWDDAAGIREVMTGKGVEKKPAWSWIVDRI